MQLNPHHPGWYWIVYWANSYRQKDYRAALDAALKINMPKHLPNHAMLAATYAKLGEREAAKKALREVLALQPDFAMVARDGIEKVTSGELAEDYIDGLRKAGLEIPATEAEAAESALGAAPPDSKPGSSSTAGGESTAVAIAVLPFSDMSADKGQQYLCEGMAEEIMNALVRIVGIRVASRTSAFRASQEGGDLAAIGRTLSVDQVLEGSIRTAGSRMRVTAQLNDVTTGYQVWSERYDREVEDVFAIQDEIAAGVVEAVKARLSSGEHAIPARPQVKNLEAYRHYLKGRFLRYTKSDNGGALREFGEAVRLDPSHGLSWVGVAECNVMAAHYCLIPTAEAYGKAKEALAAADRLRAESPEALYVEGMTAFFQWQWKSSDKAYRRALELQPSHALALGSYGATLCARFRLDEALPLFERARAADPLAPFPCAITGLGLLATGRIRESERYFEDALTFEKENMTALWGSGTAQIALGRFDEGIATLERATARMNRGAFILGLLGWGLATAGRTDEARGVLEELQARPEPAPASASEAWLLGALGDADGAWELLHRAEEERQAFLVYTGIPPYDPLRDDSRFDALLERLGLPKAGRPPATA
jgi:serine/threonine-protein kinase